MELSSVQYITSSDLTDFSPDLFLTTLGYESRCTNIARLIENVPCRKIALSRTDHVREFAFQKNKTYYETQHYQILSVEKKVPDMKQITSTSPGSGGTLKILMDCTSMSPRWYFEIFRWFADNQEGYSRVTIRIAYTLAKFANQDPVRKVRRLREVVKPERTRKSSKSALILGLGHEKSVGEAVLGMEKPDRLFLFYADPPVDKQFVEKVFVHNHSLINEVPIRNLIAYPIRNGQQIYQSLIDIILPLRNDHSITLIPHGPKIFSVVAMLIHVGYPDIQISYPEFRKPPDDDRLPWDQPVVIDAIFEDDE
jgi:hypothetical protein